MKTMPINGMRWYLRFASDGHSKDVRLYLQHLSSCLAMSNPSGSGPNTIERRPSDGTKPSLGVKEDGEYKYLLRLCG